MEQLNFFTLPSPCIGVCQSDKRGYCKGCFRNREERFNWQQFSEQQKFDVIRLCKARKRRKALALMAAKQQQETDDKQQSNYTLDFTANKK